jgi:hypothetical protein
MDKISQVTGKVNQASQQVQQIKQAKDQIQSVSQKMHKTSSKNTEAPQTKVHKLTKTTNPVKGEWGTQVTCEGPNSATCQNGLDDLVNCMNQSKGYYFRLLANHFETQLNENAPADDQERADIEADIASLNEAVYSGQVVDPDPDNPQRYLQRLSKEEQIEINKMNSKYMKEVREDCDERFGGMPR